MTAEKSRPVAQPIAPVDIEDDQGDAVAHSLRILSTVYNYNHWIYSLFRDYVGGAVLEVGAGIGNITRFLLHVDSLTCLEPTPEYQEYLAAKLADHRNVKVATCRIEDCPNDEAKEGVFDTVICLNVLEHIEDDLGALEQMGRMLKSGGKVILVVPALQWAYGELDRAMGHHRRYSRSALARKLAEASLSVVHARYFNLPGSFGWWWQGRVLGNNKIPERGTRLFDKWVPLLAAFETVFRPLFGQSLLIIVEKD